MSGYADRSPPFIILPANLTRRHGLTVAGQAGSPAAGPSQGFRFPAKHRRLFLAIPESELHTEADVLSRTHGEAALR